MGDTRWATPESAAQSPSRGAPVSPVSASNAAKGPSETSTSGADGGETPPVTQAATLSSARDCGVKANGGSAQEPGETSSGGNDNELERGDLDGELTAAWGGCRCER